MGFNSKVIKKLLAFTNNLSFEINDLNYSNALQVIDLINMLDSQKKIHLIHNTNYPIP